MNITELTLTIPRQPFERMFAWISRHALVLVLIFLAIISVVSYVHFYQNGLGLAYNDARSHLDIGRRVVEGLKPGLAQLGSVWLPLPHILMIPMIWNDFMWHSGLAGALQSMTSFVATGAVIYMFLRMLGVGLLGRVFGVVVFFLNLNVLYLQSIAMTELLLFFTMTAGVYELTKWHKTDNILALIRAAFWVMLSTLIRYDGWFLLAYCAGLIVFHIWKKRGYRAAEGYFILFCTLGSFGIFLWLLWNQLIFKDALYFAFGPFSAHAQQAQLETAGVLMTKKNLLLSLKIYLYAMVFNSTAYVTILAVVGAVVLWFDKRINPAVRLSTSALCAPFLFNILALYLGHSVLFVQGISGNTWFNVRYGATMIPSLAIFMGYLIDRVKIGRLSLIALYAFVIFFSVANNDAVTIDDARVGSSQKNVSEVSGYLKTHAANEEGFILISAASHDAIIFSSELPMKRFIHEGTGSYWESATTSPDRWARWIVMRTHDDNDLTYKAIRVTNQLSKYTMVAKFPFADVYELKSEYLSTLNTEPTLPKQK